MDVLLVSFCVIIRDFIRKSFVERVAVARYNVT